MKPWFATFTAGPASIRPGAQNLLWHLRRQIGEEGIIDVLSLWAAKPGVEDFAEFRFHSADPLLHDSFN